jgi:hypothetical protein
MKGIVFTEFLEMVEDRFSADMVDGIIDRADPPSGGAYTAVGTYDHREIVALVAALSAETGVDVTTLLHAFGQHLFARFVENFPHFFDGQSNAFSFLEGVEDYIHVEVKKLYPDAELPSVVAARDGPDRMTIAYRSDRAMAALAHGLIDGCIAHFGEPIAVELESEGEGGHQVNFALARAA